MEFHKLYGSEPVSMAEQLSEELCFDSLQSIIGACDAIGRGDMKAAKKLLNLSEEQDTTSSNLYYSAGSHREGEDL